MPLPATGIASPTSSTSPRPGAPRRRCGRRSRTGSPASARGWSSWARWSGTTSSCAPWCAWSPTGWGSPTSASTPGARRRSRRRGVPSVGDSQADRILKHLADIGAGRCTITDEIIVAEPDPNMSQILLGLLVLHEDLAYANQRRAEAEAARASVAEERERLLEERRIALGARDQFLAVASHELRTPLSTMSLLVDNFFTILTAADREEPV